jgi:IPT/TIG domain-containing protein
MAAVADFRVPGVYFLPAPRGAAFDLPPLDVAGFVGFATRGPLDVPVPIEDLKSFDAIFGGPFAVARETDGKPVFAYLRDAVAAFFSSGGTRCYVVRSAGEQAVAARFGIPGIVGVDTGGNISSAEIDASSVGEWGTGLRLGTIMTTTALPPEAFAVNADAISLTWRTSGAPQAVQQGDVLRLSFDDGRQWLFPVAHLTLGLTGTVKDTPQAMLAASVVSPVNTTVATSLPTAIATVRRMTLAGLVSLEVMASFLVVDSGIGLWLTGPCSAKVVRGDVLLLELADGSQHVIAVADAQTRQLMGSLPAPGVEVTATEMVGLRNPPGTLPGLPIGPTTKISRVERLRLSMRIKYGSASTRELDDLGFNSGHSRFWGDIAVAESGSLAGGSAASSGASQQQQSQTLAPGAATELYRDLFGDQRVDLDWTDPRLGTVLSTLLAPGQPNGLTYVPVGMPLIGTDDSLVGPDAQPAAKDDLPTFCPLVFLDRSLLGTFSAQFLLDCDLIDWSSIPAAAAIAPATLLSAATDFYYLQNRRLKGIHSLLFIDEVALVSVPDAIQRGWAPGTVEPVQVPPPPAAATPSPAIFAECLVPPVILAVDPAGGPIAQTTAERQTAVTIKGSGFADPLSVTFGGRPAAAVRVIDGTTITCLAPQGTTPGPVTVTVSSTAGTASLAAAFFYWQDSTEPPLPLANPLEGSGDSRLSSLPGASFNSGWLQTIHLSMIGLCEARADAVAILSLPLHFEKQDCVGWLQNLRQNLGLPRHGEAFADAREIADLSYAAVYHPWLLVVDPNGSSGALRPIPPDGAVCGAIAAREIAREVWVAPANVPLPGVLDLQPGFSNDDWASLFALGFNLVRQEAKDFRVMSAHTLADDRSLLQLTGRRLLIQLRKAALQRAQDYVFAKNDERFRQRVRHRLEDLLRFMFDRGAFAGRTQQSSYRVSVDASVNTRNDFDQGRIIAQILVAPAQPMEFLTVLLTRTGEGQLQTAEG